MYIGKNFKKEIELDYLNENVRHLRPNRSWLDLFSLSLSYKFHLFNYFDFTNLIGKLSIDEVIIINSHDDIFKGYQIHFWRKDRISDILPAIKCPSFKSETKIFKTSEMNKMKIFIRYQNHTKSIVIENADEELSIILVYGDTVKIGPNTFDAYQHINFFDELKERYELWEIDDCVCKPKKIRVWAKDFEILKDTIDHLKWISNINDVNLGIDIYGKDYKRSFSKYDVMLFNHPCILNYRTNFIFTGDTLVAVCDGNYYNFRLDEGRKIFKDKWISGRI